MLLEHDGFFHLIQQVLLRDDVAQFPRWRLNFGNSVTFVLLFVVFFLEVLIVLVVEIGIDLSNVVLCEGVLLLGNHLITIASRHAGLLLTAPAQPIIKSAHFDVLVNHGDDLHVLLVPAPGATDVFDLDFDHLCSIFAEVSPLELPNQLLHYQTALVLN